MLLSSPGCSCANATDPVPALARLHTTTRRSPATTPRHAGCAPADDRSPRPCLHGMHDSRSSPRVRGSPDVPSRMAGQSPLHRPRLAPPAVGRLPRRLLRHRPARPATVPRTDPALAADAASRCSLPVYTAEPASDKVAAQQPASGSFRYLAVKYELTHDSPRQLFSNGAPILFAAPWGSCFRRLPPLLFQ